MQLGSLPWIWIWEGSGSQHWEFLPQSPPLTLHIQNCPLVSWEGLGGDRTRIEKVLYSSMPSLLPPWPQEKELSSEMRAGSGTGSWNPEQRMDRLIPVTAIVSVLTKLWFGSCLAVGFLSAGIGIQ